MKHLSSVLIAAMMLLIGCGGSSTPPADPVITGFNAASNPFTYGAGTTIKADFANGSGQIDHGVGTVSPGSPVMVNPGQETTYTLTVTNGAGKTASRTLTLQVAFPVVPPTLVSPAEGAVLDNGRYDRHESIIRDYSWTAVPGATKYQLYVKYKQGLNPDIDIEVVGSTTHHYTCEACYVSGLYAEIPNAWFWRVRSYVQGQWSDWSSERSFSVEMPDTDPPRRADGYVWSTGGSLNGQAILSPTNWEVNVVAGGKIQGTINLRTYSDLPVSASAPFGYTWTWGNRTTAIVPIDALVPHGTKDWVVPIDLTAPSAPGVYYILFSFGGQPDLAHVLSCTDGTAGAAVWSEGNDLVDLTESRLIGSRYLGFAPNWPFQYQSGPVAIDPPCLPILIRVQ